MRKLSSWSISVTLCGLLLAAAQGACGSDKPTNDGGPSKGGKSSGSAGKPSSNAAAPSADGGAGDVPAGGVANAAGSGTSDGGARDTGPTGGCDLSGEGKEVVDLLEQIDFDVTLTSDKVWRISGYDVVKPGVTLTIEPCTRIVGDSSQVSALFIAMGAKIMAEGTADEPILFTSEKAVGKRKAGDWGGVVLLGKAVTNDGDALVEGAPNQSAYHYGGKDPKDSSGVIKYVRIEYAGYELSTDNELNGLTLAAIGSGTTLSHIEVSNALDDCFEWFGGSVKADHLICNSDGDDCFDTDRGFSGTMDHIFCRKRANPSADPNGFEWDNSAKNPSAQPVTNPVAEYATLCGFGYDTGTESFGAVLRRGTAGSIDNWVEAGFDYGVDVRDLSAGDPLAITNSTMFGNVKGGIVSPTDCSEVAQPNPDPLLPPIACGKEGGVYDDGFDEEAWFNGTDSHYPDNTSNTTDDPGFTIDDCQADGGPNKKVTGSGKGAFVDGNWMTGMWVDWADK